jgi:hypothetical protein
MKQPLRGLMSRPAHYNSVYPRNVVISFSSVCKIWEWDSPMDTAEAEARAESEIVSVVTIALTPEETIKFANKLINDAKTVMGRKVSA